MPPGCRPHRCRPPRPRKRRGARITSPRSPTRPKATTTVTAVTKGWRVDGLCHGSRGLVEIVPRRGEVARYLMYAWDSRQDARSEE